MSSADQSRRGFKRIATAVVLVAIPLVVSACGDAAGDRTGEGTATTIATSEPTTTSSAASEDYFAGDTYVGKKVKVTSTVEEILDSRALVLNGEQYGNDTLLVLFEQEHPDVAKGEFVTVTGTVRTFTFEEYSKKYGLLDATRYDAYADKRFLMADQIEKAAVSPSPTPVATPTSTR